MAPAGGGEGGGGRPGGVGVPSWWWILVSGGGRATGNRQQHGSMWPYLVWWWWCWCSEGGGGGGGGGRPGDWWSARPGLPQGGASANDAATDQFAGLGLCSVALFCSTVDLLLPDCFGEWVDRSGEIGAGRDLMHTWPLRGPWHLAPGTRHLAGPHLVTGDRWSGWWRTWRRTGVWCS